MRLNAYLARTGVASRRGADELIKTGRVRVNGVRGQLNTFVKEGDVVDLDGRLLVPQKLAYVLLHKPAGVVTTASDPHGRPTVVGLVEHESRVVPVGRLDADTTGALLLTNDGDLAHRLAHPRYEVEKVYEAEVEGEPSDEALARAGGRRRARGRRHRPGPRPAARPVTHRALDPRGPQAPGQAHARGGRSSRPQPPPQPLRRAHRREARSRASGGSSTRARSLRFGRRYFRADERRYRHLRTGPPPRRARPARGHVRAAPRRRRLCLDRATRAYRGGIRVGASRVRPPRARGRGCDPGASAPEAGVLRRLPLRWS